MLATTMFFIGFLVGFVIYPACKAGWNTWIKESKNDNDREIS